MEIEVTFKPSWLSKDWNVRKTEHRDNTDDYGVRKTYDAVEMDRSLKKKEHDTIGQPHDIKDNYQYFAQEWTEDDPNADATWYADNKTYHFNRVKDDEVHTHNLFNNTLNYHYKGDSDSIQESKRIMERVFDDRVRKLERSIKNEDFFRPFQNALPAPDSQAPEAWQGFKTPFPSSLSIFPEPEWMRGNQ